MSETCPITISPSVMSVDLSNAHHEESYGGETLAAAVFRETILLRSQLAAEKEEREKEKAIHRQFVKDTVDQLECLPTCDEVGHAEMCPVCNEAEAWRILRLRLEAAEARVAGLEETLGKAAHAVVVARSRFGELNGQVTADVWNGNYHAIALLQRAMEALDRAALLAPATERRPAVERPAWVLISGDELCSRIEGVFTCRDAACLTGMSLAHAGVVGDGFVYTSDDDIDTWHSSTARDFIRLERHNLTSGEAAQPGE
jgi:hypothetical protein